MFAMKFFYICFDALAILLNLFYSSAIDTTTYSCSPLVGTACIENTARVVACKTYRSDTQCCDTYDCS